MATWIRQEAGWYTLWCVGEVRRETDGRWYPNDETVGGPYRTLRAAQKAVEREAMRRKR